MFVAITPTSPRTDPQSQCSCIAYPSMSPNMTVTVY